MSSSETKKCSGPCGQIKSIDEFYKKKSKCKICTNKYKKEYDEKHKEEKRIYSKEYNLKNKEKITAKRKKDYEKNKICTLAHQKIYDEKHKEEKRVYNKEHYSKNKTIRSVQQKIYYKNNKEKISEYKKEYKEINKIELNKKKCARRKTDLNFRLREAMTSMINKYLKSNSSTKNNESCLKYLGYTIDELKLHLESLFEPWMNWSNQGQYIKSEWKDDDQSTWKWQIDHIIPSSNFECKFMTDDNFKKCWALSNLRPLSAKQNCIDGATRVRHK